jgi:hypothetical protein
MPKTRSGRNVQQFVDDDIILQFTDSEEDNEGMVMDDNVYDEEEPEEGRLVHYISVIF